MPRQTARTIGPCRATKAAKAASSRRAAKAGEQLGIGEARGTPLGEQPLNLPQSGPQLRPAMTRVLLRLCCSIEYQAPPAPTRSTFFETG